MLSNKCTALVGSANRPHVRLVQPATQACDDAAYLSSFMRLKTMRVHGITSCMALMIRMHYIGWISRSIADAAGSAGISIGCFILSITYAAVPAGGPKTTNVVYKLQMMRFGWYSRSLKKTIRAHGICQSKLKHNQDRLSQPDLLPRHDKNT